MTDFKTTKKKMFSTPMDVRALNRLLMRKIENVAEGVLKQEVTDQEIEQYIYDADSIIRAYLQSYYSETEINGQTPYYIGPVPIDGNTGVISLTGVVLSSVVVTEQWVIKFTGQNSTGVDTFSLTGSFSGDQGSGDVGTDFASTNGDVTIKAVDWAYPDTANRMNAGDQLVFASYKSHDFVRKISAMLAASFLIDALYGESESNVSSYGETFYKRAMAFLDKLQDTDSGVSLSGSVAASVDHETTGYNVDRWGRDTTLYRSIDGDGMPYSGTGSFETGM